MPEASDAEKRRLRRALSERRRRVPRDVRGACADAVARHLLASPRVVAARRVALYAALPDELPTRPLFDALAELGLPRLLPRVCGDRLEFVPVDDWQALQPGRYGVREPALARPSEPLGPEDVVVVPGVAFDASGNRLGRGGGYYDRAFPPGGSPGPLLIGAAYADQIVAAVPHDSRDRRVDAIVTERGLRWIAGST